MNRKAKALEFIGEQYTINVVGRNVLITDPMKDYAIEKMAKVERISNRIIDVLISMDIQRNDHIVDILLKINDTKIKSQAITQDMYASIDKAVDKILNQVRRYKDRLDDHHTKGIKPVEVNVDILQREADTDFNHDIEVENQQQLYEKYRPHQVVSTEKRYLSTLDREQAILKLDLSGDVFLIYRCQEDLKLKAIYRRKDNNFAIIEIES